VVPECVTKTTQDGIAMPRPKNDESFRLFRRNLGGRNFFYVRILDEEGKVIATRSTGTTDERKAVKKALEILKTIPKNPPKKTNFSSTHYWAFGGGTANMLKRGSWTDISCQTPTLTKPDSI